MDRILRNVMPTQRINFTEWLPDQPNIIDGLSDAKNVIPEAVGYGPMPSAANFSQDASENINNVGAGYYGSVTEVFAGGSSKLFKFNSTTTALDNVSKSGGYSGSTRWKFQQFGSRLLATNGNQPVQVWDIGSSTAFADVSADAPVAKYITVVKDFVVVGNVGTTEPNKVQWSDLNDETVWTTGGASQADYQLIPDGGNVNAVTGGEFGLVLCERSVTRMTYVGSPLFFQFDVISRNVGCSVPNSVAQFGSNTFFLSEDGFYMCNGETITPIGAEKVDRYFYKNADPVGLSSMSATSDPINKLIIWDYLTINNTRELLIYNWQTQRWSRSDTIADYVSSSATPNVTLEGLDTYSSSIDTLPASLDARLWAGGKYSFVGTSGAKIVTFTGNNKTAELVTNDLEFGYNSVVTLIRPTVNNGSANVSIASRRELDDNITYSSSVSASSEGRCSVRSAGRYHRVKLTPTGNNWSHAVSVDIDHQPQGNR